MATAGFSLQVRHMSAPEYDQMEQFSFTSAAGIGLGAPASVVAGLDPGYDFDRLTQLVPGRLKALQHSIASQERTMRACRS